MQQTTQENYQFKFYLFFTTHTRLSKRSVYRVFYKNFTMLEIIGYVEHTHQNP